MRNLLAKLKAVGISLAFSSAGNLEATGDREAIEKVLPLLRENKAELVAALRSPAGCTGWKCMRYEEISTGRGLLPGCLINGRGRDPWRPLRKLTACPLNWQ